jgi:hypothetical protein
MMSDEAVLHVHDLHQIHLFAIGSDTWVFPDQSLPVGEECGSMPTQDVGRAIKHNLYEFLKIIAATRRAIRSRVAASRAPESAIEARVPTDRPNDAGARSNRDSVGRAPCCLA